MKIKKTFSNIQQYKPSPWPSDNSVHRCISNNRSYETSEVSANPCNSSRYSGGIKPWLLSFKLFEKLITGQKTKLRLSYINFLYNEIKAIFPLLDSIGPHLLCYFLPHRFRRIWHRIGCNFHPFVINEDIDLIQEFWNFGFHQLTMGSPHFGRWTP